MQKDDWPQGFADSLSDCSRLNEFNEFLAKVQVDKTSSGRKFVFMNDKGKQLSYTMNQLTAHLESCVKQSIGNNMLVDKVVKDLTNLSDEADDHLMDIDAGCFFVARRALGNFFYKITHFGFDKAEVLKNIENHSITGRHDISVGMINSLNAQGITPLNDMLMQNKKVSELYRNVKEMLENGADPRIANSDGENSYSLVMTEAEKGNILPVGVLFGSLTLDQYRGIIHSIGFTAIVEIMHRRFRNCVVIADQFVTTNELRNFIRDYREYLEKNPLLLVDDSVLDHHGQHLDIYMELGSDNMKFIQSRYMSKQV